MKLIEHERYTDLWFIDLTWRVWASEFRNPRPIIHMQLETQPGPLGSESYTLNPNTADKN